MGVTLAHQTQPGSVDRPVDAWIRDHFSRNLPVFKDAVWLGDPRQITVICAVIVLACAVTRRFRAAFLVAIAVPLAGATTEYALKPLIDRTLWGNVAFPSGHTTGVCALAVVIVVLLTGPERPPLPGPWRWLLSALVLLLVALTAVSVVALHFHYFTDTIGGVAVGSGIALLTAFVIDWLSPRLSRPRPAAPGPALRNPDRRRAERDPIP
jgi:membrane-associated phospholipid phosphatase